MMQIEKTINELCPNGVEYVKLSDVLVSVKTGLNPRQNFKLNIDGANNYYVTVKEITTGKILFSDKTDRITDEARDIIQNRSRLEMGDVLLSGIGTIGKVALVDIPTDNWNCSESVFLLKPKKELIEPKFLMYLLASKNVQKQWESQSVGSTLRGIRMETVNSLLVPLPPLAAQREIVRVLDKFTLLSSELAAELAARRVQYEFYRDDLLTFKKNSSEVQWLKLGDIATISRGGNFQKKDFVEEGFPCIHYGQIYTRYGTSADKTFTFISKEVAKTQKKASKTDIVMAVTSENVEDVCKCVAWIGDDDIAVSGHTAIIKHKENPKFLSYYFQTNHFYKQKEKLAHGTKVIEVTPDTLNNVVVPIPTRDVQDKIVYVLENFDKICSDLKIGLPAEIEKRQQQYEYYRDMLLSFNYLTKTGGGMI